MTASIKPNFADLYVETVRGELSNILGQEATESFFSILEQVYDVKGGQIAEDPTVVLRVLGSMLGEKASEMIEPYLVRRLFRRSGITYQDSALSSFDENIQYLKKAI
jgi:hypothetical protein